MIHTPAQALEFVRKHGIVTMTKSSRPSLVDAIAGPVKGSWWGHPKGGLIFRLADTLHDSPDVLSTKLVEGKVTFVDRALWPALAKVVTDTGRRRATMSSLPDAAKILLKKVERQGRVRMERESKAAGLLLERSQLAHCGSEHTEKGSHTTVLTSWKRIFKSDTMARARRLKLPEALELLGLATVP